ncbi:immunoglobulin-like domain-containing protein [Paenibacillus sp. Y412MC10]|uniref:immunoglobulin-like domain-containing protein n=1 Tax=Geobacillus sp. (strain Y412MC10) TaxID=481743 RepID=UPI0011A4D908|nr:immunoglobulin-like domain-containing protein [Paenibacillus sp. Y412MC10]
MKKGLHGTLTGLLGFGMTLGAVSPAFAAQPAKDINGHWAEKQLQEWVNQGTLKGFEDGTVRPNQSITRAEFIALVNRIFGYTESTDVQFSDLSSSNWAYTDVAKAVKAGYVQGYQDKTIHPSADVTRQEAAAMIAKIVGLTAGQTDSLSSLKDAERISAWSKQGVAAVLESKIMNGYPNQTFEPHKSLTRAEAVVLIDAAFVKKVSETVTFDKAGTYDGTEKEIQVIHGNVVISAPGITLQNVEIQGNLTLAEGIGSGDATLKNVKVHGTTNVQGGGENSIHFVDSVLVNIVVNKKDGTVRIVAEGSTVTQSVVVKSSAKLEEDHASGEGFTNVELSKELPANAKVTLNGTFDDVDVFAASISVQLVKGSIENVHVDGSAGNSSIELSSEAKIVKLVLDAVAKLLGSGQIQTATINDGAKGSTFQTKPNQTEGSQKDSIQVSIPASSSNSGGSNSGGSSGGSSGGGNNGGGTTTPTDTVAPVITLKGESTVTLAYGAEYVDEGVTITDNKDTGLLAKVTYTKDGQAVDSIDTTKAGTYSIHYNVSDAAGNVAKEITRTVIVKEKPDTEKPVIELKGEASVSVDFGAKYEDAGVSVTDNKDTELEVTVTYTKDGQTIDYIDTTEAGTYILHYNVSDAAGNAANEVTRTVIVKEEADTEKPVIELKGEASVLVEFGAEYEDAGVSVTDNKDTELEVTMTYTKDGQGIDDIDTTKAGTYTIHYNVSDAAGNAADEVTRTVIVKEEADTEKPMIQLKGEAIVSVAFSEEYKDAGVTVTDNKDTELEVIATYTKDGQAVDSIDTTKAGTYIIHYNVSDAAGNAADEVTRTVIVKEELDTEKPVIELKGEAIVSVAFGEEYKDAGVTVTDNKDTELKVTVTYTKEGQAVDSIDTTEAGTYIIHYNVSDAAGNAADEVTRSVIVKNNEVATVDTLDELIAALSDETKSTINITANIETDKKITVTRKVSINGGNHSVTFKGDAVDWQGNYVLHVYNTSGVTISDLNLTGGDAGLLVNGSDVTLEGDVNVGGNEFGGIEVSKGAASGLNNSVLNVAGTLTNETESYGKPTIWVIDGQGEVDNGPATSTTTIEPGQTQYYLEAIHGSPVITSTIKEAAYTDVEQDVEVSTAANGKAGSNVKVVITLDDSTQAENLDLQYFEVNDRNYHPLNFNSGVAVFGPSSGFQLKDAKSKFKVTYKQVGTYGYKLELVEVESSKVLATSKHEVVVTEAPKPEDFVIAQDFGYWTDYQAYNVGFQLQLNNISYDDIEKIEVALEDVEGKLLATRTATGTQIEKLASDDLEYGGLDGQLSAAFTDREEEGSNEWWDSTSYDITQKPSKAKITITLKNGESYSVYNMILIGEYVPETPEEPVVTDEQQVSEEPQKPQDTPPTEEQQGSQDAQELGLNN